MKDNHNLQSSKMKLTTQLTDSCSLHTDVLMKFFPQFCKQEQNIEKMSDCSEVCFPTWHSHYRCTRKCAKNDETCTACFSVSFTLIRKLNDVFSNNPTGNNIKNYNDKLEKNFGHWYGGKSWWSWSNILWKWKMGGEDLISSFTVTNILFRLRI